MATKWRKISDHEKIPANAPQDMLIYIVPKKITKARLQMLNNLARKKGFPITEAFSGLVTHIVTSYETVDKVLAFLKRPNLKNVDIVSIDWLTDCTTVGRIVEVTDKVRVKSTLTTTEEQSRTCNETEPRLVSFKAESYQDTKFVCQRAIPLRHYNHKFTDALEILERHAIYVDSSQRDSRALAFRRAACSLKSFPRQITRIEEAAKLSSIGSHSKKVIQEILENGFSHEIERIVSSEFFKAMEIFSSVYGCGPATARKWYEKGYHTMADVTDAVTGGMKLTEQQAMGLKYYNDLIQPVPRNDANLIKEIVAKELNSLQPDCVVELVGGYRRGKGSGHDVDILITHPDGSKIEGLVAKLVERLDKLGHMCHKELMVGHNSNNETKRYFHKNVKGITEGSQRIGDEVSKETVLRRWESETLKQIINKSTMDHLDHCFCMFQVEGTIQNKSLDAPSPSKCSFSEQETNTNDATTDKATRRAPVRRVDLIVAPPNQFSFALLGWTGSKQFNRSLRDYAWKILKVKLSNHGMWDYNHAPPQQLQAESEHEIFSALQLEYREPEDRNA